MMVATKSANRAERVAATPPTPPFEKLRRAFIVGRPTEVVHNPVSGVSAAQGELKRLEDALADSGMQCQVQVGLVVSTPAREGAGLFVVSHSAHHAAEVITSIAALKEPKLLGLVYAVVDPKTMDFEFWTKAFFKGRATEKLLDLWVVDGVNKMLKKMKGGTD
jgi:hypothetical protein